MKYNSQLNTILIGEIGGKGQLKNKRKNESIILTRDPDYETEATQ